METIFDNMTIEIECPNCEQGTPLTIVEIKTQGKYTCGGCRETVRLDATGLSEGLETADKAIDDFVRSIEELNKGK